MGKRGCAKGRSGCVGGHARGRYDESIPRGAGRTGSIFNDDDDDDDGGILADLSSP